MRLKSFFFFFISSAFALTCWAISDHSITYTQIGKTLNGFNIFRSENFDSTVTHNLQEPIVQPNTQHPISLSKSTQDVIFENFNYEINLDTKEARFCGLPGGYMVSSIEIPSTITVDGETYTVTMVSNLGLASVTEVTLPESVRRITSHAFDGCGISEITFPDALEIIEYEAFQNSKLEKINWGKGLKTLERDVFKNTLLTEIRIPATVTTIGERLCCDCKLLTSVYIPASVESITYHNGFDFCANCPNLRSLEIDPDNPKYFSHEGFIYEREHTRLIGYVLASEEIVTLPDFTKQIFHRTFENTHVKEVICNEGLEYVCYDGFSYAYDLENVQFKDGVEFDNLPAGIFHLSKLKSIRIPETTRRFPQMGVVDSLKDVYIGASVVHLWGNDGLMTKKLHECKNFSTIKVSDANPYLTVRDNILYNTDCSELIQIAPDRNDTEIVIPESVNRLGEKSVINIRQSEIRLPSHLWRIDWNAFGNSGVQTRITIPGSTRYICNFWDNPTLNDIYFSSIVPPPFTRTDMVAPDCNKTLHVPADRVEEFKNTDNWKNFNIVGDAPSPSSQVFDFGYGGMDYNDSHVLMSCPACKVGILVTKEELKPYIGMKITSVQSLMHWMHDWFVFVENAETGEELAIQEGFGRAADWNSISFENPYVITGECDLIIGGGRRNEGFGISYSGKPMPNKSWVKEPGGSWRAYNSNQGAFAISCSIEGDHVPYDIRVREVEHDGVSTDGIVHFRGKLENLAPDIVKSVVLNYIVKPSDISQELSGNPVTGTITIDTLAIQYGRMADVEFDIDLWADNVTPQQTKALGASQPAQNRISGKVNIELCIDSINGRADENPANDLTVMPVEVLEPSKFSRRIVYETTLGTWCPYSALGKQTLGILAKEYPDNFIGCAIHFNDELAPDDSYGYFVGRTGSVPGGLLNRSTVLYPNIDDVRKALKNVLYTAKADIAADAHFANEACTEIFINTTSQFTDKAEDSYKLAFAFIEDNVGPIYQNSGYDIPEIGLSYGGSNILHHGVARSIADVDGLAGTEIQAVEPDCEYPRTVKLTVPANVKNSANMHIVAMLLNQNSGEIENATRVQVNDYRFVPVTRINLNETNISIAKGEQFTLISEVLPADASNPELKYTSSNPEIATVDSDGLITALSSGTCDIIAEATDDSGVRAVCHINALSSIESLIADGVLPDVINTQGIVLKHAADSDYLHQLPRGIYILRYDDTSVKIVK